VSPAAAATQLLHRHLPLFTAALTHASTQLLRSHVQARAGKGRSFVLAVKRPRRWLSPSIPPSAPPLTTSTCRPNSPRLRHLRPIPSTTRFVSSLHSSRNRSRRSSSSESAIRRFPAAAVRHGHRKLLRHGRAFLVDLTPSPPLRCVPHDLLILIGSPVLSTPYRFHRNTALSLVRDTTLALTDGNTAHATFASTG
jgi:hypothetical protein